MEATPGRERLIEQFKADGLKVMFGNPGTVEQGFLDAVDAAEDFTYILALQETVAMRHRRRVRPGDRRRGPAPAALRGGARQRHRHALPVAARPHPARRGRR